MKKNKTLKRFLAFLLCAAMVITYMPSSVYTLADESGDNAAVEETAAEPVQEEAAEEPAPAPAPEAAEEEAPAPAEEAVPAEETDPEATPEASEPADPAPAEAEPAETEPETSEPAEPEPETAEPADQEKDEEAVVEEETEDEVRLNAKTRTFTGAANSVNVKVVAAPGTFPEGTTMKVAYVAKNDVRDAVEGAIGDAKDFRAVDITFYANGKEVQPEKDVAVKLSTSAFDTSNDLSVVHVEESGTAEVMDLTQASDSMAQFRTDGFSVYVVVETGEDARLKVIFKNGDTEIASTTVKKSDIDSGLFDQIIYDPGVGELGAGEVFRGWTTKENYTTADIDNGMNIDEVRAAVKEKLNAGVTEVDGNPASMVINAMIFKAVHVTYKDEDSVVIRNDAILAAKGSSEEITYEINEPYVPKTPDQEFQGWYFTSPSEVKDSDGNAIPAGSAIANESTVKITDDLILTVKAPKGAWLIFKENGPGASYTSPQFLENEKPTRPSDPTRFGYTFGGWFKDEACTDEFDFDKILTETTRVYAKWTENTTANYTVIIWRQKVTDAKDAEESSRKYDFAESVSLTGDVGSTINTVTASGNGDNRYASVNGTAKRYTGFHLGRYDQNVKVKSDGTSVVNVYYDRNLITLIFRYRNNGSWATQATMTGLYGSTLASNGYTWPTNRWWYDDYNSGIGGYSAAGTRTTFLDAFIISDGSSSQTFYGFGGTGNRNVYWYKQQTNGSWPATSDPDNQVQTTNGTFNISDKYNGYHVVSYSTNGTNWTNVSGKDAQGYYARVSNYNSLYIRCAPDLYNIQFNDGIYVDGNGVAVEGYSSRGELKVEQDIPYASDISSYDKGGDNYYEPAFNGFVFDGWYIDDTCTQACSFTNMPEGMTVYAKWVQKQYRVFLHPNVPTSDTSFSMGEQNTSFRVDFNDSISAIDARRDDYELVGWYTDENLKNSFNFDAYTLNDTTVTTAYDQTQSTETDLYGNPTSDTNSDRANNRYWIDKKLDLYAKWRSKLIGANGITVVYDSGEGSFEGGGNTYTDPLTYKDLAKAVATTATIPNNPDKKEFESWEILKYENGEFVSTGETVLPGDQFEVLKAYTQQTENEDSTPDDPSYTYTFKLRANYKDVEEETLTHIDWYANNGTTAVKKDEKLKMNEAINIEPATLFSYEGYQFIGWSRWEEGLSPSQPTDTTNLWLYYNNGKFYTDSGFTTEAKQVACDEKTPYHNLYAVWKEYPNTTFKASKKLEGRAWKSTDSFTFTLTAKDGAPMPGGSGNTATFTNDSEKEFGKIYFPNATAETTYEYTISETSALPSNVAKSEDITVTVTFEEKDGELVPKVEYTNNGTITNTYTPDELIVDPEKAVFGKKNVVAGTDAEGGKDFSFTLTAVTDNAPMPNPATATLHYDAGATGEKPIPFGKITYKKAGTYEYKVEETPAGEGWTTEADPEIVKVVIADDGDGNLSVESVTEAIIKNKYSAKSDSVDPSEVDFGLKDVTAGTDAEAGKTFSFTLKALTQGAPMPAEGGETATVTYTKGQIGQQRIPFGKIEYKKAGTFEYTITEADPGTGWTATGNNATVKVVVTDNGAGKLVAEVTPGKISNAYTAGEITVDPTKTETTFGKKNVTAGTDAEEGKDFSFTLTAVTKDAPMPNPATATLHYDAGATGEKTIPFGKITYTAAGEYKYKITEAAAGDGWTTTGNNEEITVTVTDNGDGTLSAEVDKTAEISNTYSVQEIPVDPTDDETTFGKKDLTATTEDGEGHTFNFTLEAVTKNAPMPESAEASVTYEAGETGEQTIPFGTITYSAAGKYEYTITESTEGYTDGWTVSNNPANVIVTVTDNGDGTLSASVNTAKITNAYAVSEIDVNPTSAKTTFGKKNVTATTQDNKAHEFSFTLEAVTENAPMPENASAKLNYAAGETGSKAIPFGEITYTKAGNYTYKIKEAEVGDGWNTETSTVEVTVEVKDNGDGSLSAEVKNTPEIRNTYSVEEIEVDPADAETTFGKKNVTAGTDAEEGKDFSFTLTAVTKDAPMPNPATATLHYDAGATGEKTIPFGKITYTAAGEYKYKITEAAAGDGWTTTNNDGEVTVTVTDNGDGTLSAAVKTATAIKNAYEAEEIVVDPKEADTTFGKKNVTAGTDAEAGKDFNFTLKAETEGAPMPAASNATLHYNASEKGEKTIPFGSISFKKAGIYEYTISEAAAGDGWTTKNNNAKVKVTVTDNGDGTLSAAVQADTAIENAYKAKEITVDPADTDTTFGRKSVTATTEDGKGHEFNFTLSAEEGTPMPSNASAKVSYAKDETGEKPIPFGKITYTAAGEYKYTITEAAAGDGWETTNNGGEVTVKVTDNGNGTLSAEVTPAPVIKNAYTTKPLVVDPTDAEAKTVFGKKDVTATTEDGKGHKFSFTLAKQGDAPMPESAEASVTYEAGKTGEQTIPFGEITYSKTGTYTYKITESAAGDGWTTTGSPATVTVTVTDNGDGSLSAAVSTATITNNYAVEPLEVDPTDAEAETVFGKKNVTAAAEDGKDKTFNFTLSAVTDKAPMPENVKASLTYASGATGARVIPFGKITYTAAGEYKYKITEAAAGDGWTTTGNNEEITVTVTDNGNGTLSAKVSKTAEIKNNYSVDNVTVDPTYDTTKFGVKNVTKAAEDGKAKTFNFTLEAVTKNAPMPESAEASVTYAAGKTGEQTIPFGEITYSAAGEYEYKITEDDPGKGWTVSNNGATVIVKVTDNGNGTLSAAVERTPEIGNGYKAEEITVDPTNDETTFGEKNVTATTKDNKGHKFVFTLEAVTEGAPMPESNKAEVSYDAGATGVKTIPFGSITYENTGTYTYKITETDPGKGWTVTGNEATVTVKITDNGDGTLKAKVEETPQVENNYSVDPIEVDPTDAKAKTEFGKKNVTATTKDGNGHEFSFTLAKSGDAPMPNAETANVSYDKDETGKKTIPFGKITYTEVGEYKYTIKEADAGGGWTTTGNNAEVTVTVTDNGDGTLSAKVEKTAEITNTYATEPLVVDPTDAEAKTEFGKKNVTATTEDGKSHEFGFTLKKSGNAPMPDKADAKVSYNKGETGTKTIPFGAITYTEVGEYKYTIKEANAGGGWTTTGNNAEVTVTVTDNGDGTMSAAVDGKTIENKYAVKPLVVDPTDSKAKTVFGKKLVTSTTEDGKDKSFSFTIKAVTEGAPMPESDTAAVSYKAGKTGVQTIPFDKITYTKTGEYTYKISEANAGSGWTTTDNDAEVTVKVTDNGDGTMKAEVGTKTIKNSYKAEPAIVDDKGDDGNPLVRKIVKGEGFDPEEFKFRITAETAGAPLPSPAEGTVTMEEADSKTVDFGNITFDKAGTYVYTVRETAEASSENWTNDTSEKTVMVVVKDNGKGQLVTEVRGAKVTNKYVELVDIVYHLNGGIYNGSPDDIVETYPVNTWIKIHEKPTREGYRFVEWRGSSYQPGDDYLVTEHHEFVAIWEKEDDGDDGNRTPGPGPGHGPDTGDHTGLMGMIGLFGASIAGFFAMIFRRRREQE